MENQKHTPEPWEFSKYANAQLMTGAIWQLLPNRCYLLGGLFSRNLN